MDPRAAVTAPGRRAGDGPAASTSSRSRPHPVVFVDRRYSSLGLKGSPLYTYEHVVDHHDDDATRFLYRAQSAVLRRARNVPEHRVLALVHMRAELRADGVSWMRQGSTVPTRPPLCGHLPVPGLVPLLRALPVGPEPRQSGAEKTAGHSQHRDRSLLGHAQRRRRHRRDRSTFRSMSVPASSRGSGKGCRCGRSHCGAASRWATAPCDAAESASVIVRVLSVNSRRTPPTATKNAPYQVRSFRELPARLGRCHRPRPITNQLLYRLS
jgi:hypothetical protein